LTPNTKSYRLVYRPVFSGGSFIKKVGFYEAKTHFARILDEVSRGEQISITRKSTPVAMLIPIALGAKADPKLVLEKTQSFRKGKKLGELSIQKMINEGRRY
jgi:prevent-host-death family protein